MDIADKILENRKKLEKMIEENANYEDILAASRILDVYINKAMNKSLRMEN